MEGGDLQEMDNRKLYLEQGFSSLFTYCTGKLKYSEPAANRRITAARCIRENPKVYELLLKREVSLSSVALFTRILTPENSEAILKAVANKSKQEVLAYLASYKPKMRTREYVRPVVIKSKSAEPKQENLPSPEKVNSKQAASDKPRANDKAKEGIGEALGLAHTSKEQQAVDEVEYELKFRVKESFIRKLNRVKALKSKGPRIAQRFEALMDEYLRRNDPELKSRARAQRILRADEKRTRYIRQSVKDLIRKRDGLQCAFVSRDGKRCECKTSLQLDHIHPCGKGGSNQANNLCLLCPEHNRYMAEKHYGSEQMRQFTG